MLTSFVDEEQIDLWSDEFNCRRGNFERPFVWIIDAAASARVELPFRVVAPRP